MNSILQKIIKDKHEKYYKKYKPNDYFHGLGIENETYFQFENPYGIVTNDITTRLKREPYSVNYYKNYNILNLKNTLEKIVFPTGYQKINEIPYWNVPLYLNSHTFNYQDANQNTVKNKPYSISLFNDMCKYDNYFFKNYGKTFIFDGDSIEIMTCDFYNSTVENVCKELMDKKTNLLEKINKYFKDNCSHLTHKYGNLMYPKCNNGIVTFLTNLGNISICNNSTYHINITLPTLLDENCNIKDKTSFLLEHENAIKVIQFVLPLVIACYGSPDFLYKGNENYLKGSLRVGMSRYISIGTYDSEEMKPGKILDNFNSSECKWYSKLKKDLKNYYTLLDYIGYDFNYNKYKNHGIEIRVFDWFPEKYLPDLINFLLLLCSFSQVGQLICEFKRLLFREDNQRIYQDVIYGCIKEGKYFKMNKEQVDLYLDLFNINKENKDYTPYVILEKINEYLYEKFKNSDLVNRMSPNMSKPNLIEYNNI